MMRSVAKKRSLCQKESVLSNNFVSKLVIVLRSLRLSFFEKGTVEEKMCCRFIVLIVNQRTDQIVKTMFEFILTRKTQTKS